LILRCCPSANRRSFSFRGPSYFDGHAANQCRLLIDACQTISSHMCVLCNFLLIGVSSNTKSQPPDSKPSREECKVVTVRVALLEHQPRQRDLMHQYQTLGKHLVFYRKFDSWIHCSTFRQLAGLLLYAILVHLCTSLFPTARQMPIV